MRFFKHYTDNHRGRSMQFLMDELGHVGPCSYYILLEMCAEKLQKNPEKDLEESDCLFNFHQRILRQNLRISLTNLRRMLDICQTFGLLSYQFCGSSVQINFPKLLKLLESDQKKTRLKRDRVAMKSRLDIDIDIERDVDVDVKETKTNASENFQDSFRPEISLFRNEIEKYGIDLNPSLKRILPKIAKEFEFNLEKFQTWSSLLVSGKSFQSIADKQAKTRYYIQALRKEVGL